MEYTRPRFFEIMAYAREADRDVIDLVSGNPDWDPPAGVRDGLEAVSSAPPANLQYPPSEGLPELREAIANRQGVSRDQVIVTNGAAEANYLALAGALETNPGTEVILFDPVYPYYPEKVRLLGGKPQRLSRPVTGTIDLKTVEEAISTETATIMLTTPDNPTGAVQSGSTLEQLDALAHEYDATLISDEVYDEFDYSGTFRSARDVSDRALVTNSFSKTFAITGFRVGYLLVPEHLFDPARTRHLLTTITASRPAQAAVRAGLKADTADYQRQARQRMNERIDQFIEILTADGVTCQRPDGGFYVNVNLEEWAGTTEDVKAFIDAHGVAGMPGEHFGENFDDWIRFALLTDRVEEAAERIRAAAAEERTTTTNE